MGLMRGMWALAAVLCGPLAAETLAGRVVEDHTGNPLASVEVRVFGSSGSLATGALETDSEGRFSAGLPSGSYRIELAKTNYTNTWVQYRLSENPGVVTVRMARCGAMAGHVIDSAGKAVRGARVVALTRVSTSAAAAAETDDRGQYRIYGLPAGQYTLGAALPASNGQGGTGVVYYPDSARPQVFTVSGGEEFGGIDFSVPPGGGFHVSGKIQEVNAGTGYSIALTPVDQPAIAAARVNVSPDGSFRFEGIPSGRYYALVTGPVMGWGAVGVMLGDAPVYGRGTVDVVGQDVDGLALSLGEPRGVTIAMRAGSGCPGSARVVLRALEDWGAMFNWSATVAMGEERRFERLPPERFLVTASDPAERCFPNSETTVDLTGGQSERAVVVQLVTAGAIHGRLVGTERGSDFVVVMVASDPAGMTGRVQATFSDAGGRFNISGLHPGTYRIAAQAATGRWIGDLAGMMEIDIRGGSPTDLELPVALGK